MAQIRKIKDTRYSEYGTGDDVIIMIHGFLSSSHYWRKITPHLVDAGYRVVLIDLLGFGRAQKPSTIAYGYEDQISHIAGIIDDLAISKPVHLVGHSMGAVLAARYAKHYPKQVQSLTMLHPPLYRTPGEAQKTLNDTGRMYRYLLGSKYRGIGWVLLRSLVPGNIASHTRYSREQSLKNIILKAEAISDLQALRVKTLLLVGTRDRPLYQDSLPLLQANRYITMIKEDVSHHSPVRNPQLVRQHILGFINQA